MILTFLAFVFLSIHAFRLIRRKFAKPDFTDKTVWITGGSSGLGEYLAYEFSKCNASKIILSARNMDELQRVKANCLHPSRVQIVQMDMTKFQEVNQKTQQIITQLQQQGRKIDIMVQNAGVSMRTDLLNTNFENHQYLMKLNLDSVVNHLKVIYRHMVNYRSGQIVCMSSYLSKVGIPNRTSYCASKYALNGLVDSLRYEAMQYGITVTNVLPGYIQSNVGLHSLTSQKGQVTGKKDPNYETGMPTPQFAQQTVRGIYRQEYQFHVSNKRISHPINFFLRAFCPQAQFLWTRWQYRGVIKTNKDNYFKN